PSSPEPFTPPARARSRNPPSGARSTRPRGASSSPSSASGQPSPERFPPLPAGYMAAMTIAAAIFLIAGGAILRYATNLHVQGVSIDTVGLILMIAGALGLILSFFQEMIWTDRARRREAAAYEERREVPPREVPPREPPARY